MKATNSCLHTKLSLMDSRCCRISVQGNKPLLRATRFWQYCGCLATKCCNSVLTTWYPKRRLHNIFCSFHIPSGSSWSVELRNIFTFLMSQAGATFFKLPTTTRGLYRIYLDPNGFISSARVVGAKAHGSPFQQFVAYMLL